MTVRPSTLVTTPSQTFGVQATQPGHLAEQIKILAKEILVVDESPIRRLVHDKEIEKAIEEMKNAVSTNHKPTIQLIKYIIIGCRNENRNNPDHYSFLYDHFIKNLDIKRMEKDELNCIYYLLEKLPFITAPEMTSLQIGEKLFYLHTKPDFNLYAAMILGLAQSGFPEEALNYYQDLKEWEGKNRSGRKMPPINYQNIITELSGAGFFVEIVSLIEDMRALGVNRTPKIYREAWVALRDHGGSRINGRAVRIPDVTNLDLSKEEDYLAVLKAQRDHVVSLRGTEDDPLVKNMSHKIGKNVYQGNIHEALALLRQMRKRNIQPNSVTYLSLIKGVLAKEMFAEADALFLEMQPSVKPTLSIFNTFFAHYGAVGQLGKVRFYWDEMVKAQVEPDAITLHSIIPAYYQAGRNESVIRIFNDLYRPSMDRNHVAYRIAVLFFIKSLCTLAADEYKEEYLNLAHSYLPQLTKEDTLPLLNLIRAHMAFGRVQEAKEFFDQGTHLEAEHRAPLYRETILGLIKAGQADEAFSYFQKMVEEMDLDFPFLSRMITYLANHYNVDVVEKVYDYVCEKISGLEIAHPDFFTTVIQSFERAKIYKKVAAVYEKMREKGVELTDTLFYKHLLQISRNGDHARFTAVFKQMESETQRPPTLAMFNLQIRTAFASRRWEEGWNAYNRLRPLHTPDVTTFRHLISAYQQSHQKEKIPSLLNEMKRLAMAVPVVISTELAMESHDHSFLSQLISTHENNQQGHLVDTATCNALIMAYSTLNRPDQALAIYDEMQTGGEWHLNPDFTTYRKALEVCLHHTKAKKALDIWEQMLNEGITDPVCCVLLIKNLLKQYGKDHALKFFERVKTLFPFSALTKIQSLLLNQIDLNLGTPDENEQNLFTFYVRSFQMYLKEGRLNDLFNLFDEMKKSGFIPNKKMYELALNKFLEDPLYSTAALHLLQEMAEYRLIQSLEIPEKIGRAKSSEDFKMIYKNVLLPLTNNKMSMLPAMLLKKRAEGGNPVSTLVFNCLLKALGEKGFIEKAFRLVEQVGEYRVELDIDSYNALLYGCLVAQEGLTFIDRIQGWIDEGRIDPNATTFSYLTEAYFALGNFEMARHVFSAETLTNERVIELDDKNIVVNCNGLTQGMACLLLENVLSNYGAGTSLVVMTETLDYSLISRRSELTLQRATDYFSKVPNVTIIPNEGEIDRFTMIKRS